MGDAKNGKQRTKLIGTEARHAAQVVVEGGGREPNGNKMPQLYR